MKVSRDEIAEAIAKRKLIFFETIPMKFSSDEEVCKEEKLSDNSSENPESPIH